jgi:hypothetical protein
LESLDIEFELGSKGLEVVESDQESVLIPRKMMAKITVPSVLSINSDPPKPR